MSSGPLRAGPPAESFGAGLVAVDVAAELAEQLGHRVDVGEAGDAFEGGLPVGQQAGGHDRQRAVLGAGDFDFAFEACSAADEKAVH